jgi:hypothetical protein
MSMSMSSSNSENVDMDLEPTINIDLGLDTTNIGVASININNKLITAMTQTPKNVNLEYIKPRFCDVPVLPMNNILALPPDIINSINIASNENNDVTVRVINQKIAENFLVERGSCRGTNSNIFDDARLHMFNIDDEALGNRLKNESALDSSIHDDIACAVDSITYPGKQSGEYAPFQRERIRNWLSKIKQIGDESVQGYALRASPSEKSELFVIKAPRNPKKDELVHEAIVGFYAINKIRRFLPNYMYVYGYTKCSPPALINKEPVTWCSGSNPAVSYLITENIRDAVSIGDFIIDPKITRLDFMAVFLQILNALNVAYKMYGYTHYDLHYGNIMVRKYSKMVAIPYYGSKFDGMTKSSEGYIATSYVPYIIDYGYSRITVGGYAFGKIGLEFVGIKASRAFPMYDVYKIIGFLGEKLYSKRLTPEAYEIRSMLDDMFLFFKDGSLRDRVAKRLKGNDWYNAPERLENITHDEFIQWLKSQTKLPVHVDMELLRKNNVILAPINTKLNMCEFYDLVSDDNGPKSSLQYCEVVSAINDDLSLSEYDKQTSLAWLNDKFDASEYFVDNYEIAEEYIQVADDIKQSRLLPRSNNMIPLLSNSGNVATQQFVKLYKQHIIDFLQLKDVTSELISFLRASICSLATQGTYNKHSNEIKYLADTTSKLTVFIDSQREILNNNLRFAKSINWSPLTNDSSVIKFFTEEHENLILAA